MYFNLCAKDIARQAMALVEFHGKFVRFFQTRTRCVAAHALQYLKGLFLVESERTMKEMERRASDSNCQALGHFISTSPWQDAPLLKEVQRGVVEIVNTGDDSALIIDESSFEKQGRESVGVKRQYCGSLGKVDNCQVAVFLAYASRTQTSLIARKLYLPKEWVEDAIRCEKADIPESMRQFKTKAELALDLVDEAIKNQVPFRFIHMDAHYGGQPWLLESLEDRKRIYVADIAKDTQLFLGTPQIVVEERSNERFKMMVQGEGSITVEEIVTRGKAAFNTMTIRDVQRGKLIIKFAALRVRRSKGNIPVPGECWLLIRQELDGSEIKYSLSNAAESTDLSTLAEWQSRRYWVERALEDAKGIAGLDQYRVTGWLAWHHHTAMVLLAMLFLLTQQAALKGKAPMLTLQDALEIVRNVIPRKQLTHEDATELIKEKHRNRYDSRESRLKTQQARLKKDGVI